MVKNAVAGCVVVALIFMGYLAFYQKHEGCWRGHLLKDPRQMWITRHGPIKRVSPHREVAAVAEGHQPSPLHEGARKNCSTEPCEGLSHGGPRTSTLHNAAAADEPAHAALKRTGRRVVGHSGSTTRGGTSPRAWPTMLTWRAIA